MEITVEGKETGVFSEEVEITSILRPRPGKDENDEDLQPEEFVLKSPVIVPAGHKLVIDHKGLTAKAVKG